MRYNTKQLAWAKQGLCILCGKDKPTGRVTCRECSKKASIASSKRYHEIRSKIIAAYGGSCTCCNENRAPFLAIDHLPGNKRTKNQANLTQWIDKHEYPRGFRLLCHNCNMATRWGKTCPHKETEPCVINIESLESTAAVSETGSLVSQWIQRLTGKRDPS